jgi:hypothetical protein
VGRELTEEKHNLKTDKIYNCPDLAFYFLCNDWRELANETYV